MENSDIEVRNALNLLDPSLWNVPWEGHSNTVVARVYNAGLADAPGVLVNFSVKDYNVSGAPETYLDKDIGSIPAGATVEFTCDWTPAKAGHFCIVARILPYNYGPQPEEVTTTNNQAQSNYGYFISTTASPASREMTTVVVGNPSNKRARSICSLLRAIRCIGLTSPTHR